MEGKYRAYPEYKDSGVEFIGRTPEDWDNTKFKYAIDFQEGPGILAKDFFDSGVPLLRIQNTKEAYVTDNYKTYLNAETVNRKWKQFKVELGDIIISCSASTELVSEVDERTVGAIPYTGLIRLRPISDSVIKEYIKYFVQSEVYHEQIRVLQTGSTIQHYGPIHLNQISLSVPEIYTQNSIANFLDHETAKIDTLIEKQQQLIALLMEKRQAVISHAVTKGLNPDVPMKHSGVEWLGEVPAHWRCCSLKFQAQVIDCKHITAEFLDDGIPLASISEVKDWYVNLDFAKYTNEKFYLELIEGGRKPEVGDIIYSRNATVGEAAIVCKGMPLFAMGQDVCLIRLAFGVVPEYLLYTLKSGIISQQLDLAMVGSTFKRINVDSIRNFQLTVPPIKEQLEIIALLRDSLYTFDSVISKAENATNLLQERRTALISAAVTGKIDVRNWQPPTTPQNSPETP